MGKLLLKWPIQTAELCSVDYCENQATWMVQFEGDRYQNPLCGDHIGIVEHGASVPLSIPRN